MATWCKDPIHWKRPWCWARLRAGEEGGNRGWNGWMVSPTQWTWVWANARRWWRTGKPGVLQSMGSQRVWHDLATTMDLNNWINQLLFISSVSQKRNVMDPTGIWPHGWAALRDRPCSGALFLLTHAPNLVYTRCTCYFNYVIY